MQVPIAHTQIRRHAESATILDDLLSGVEAHGSDHAVVSMIYLTVLGTVVQITYFNSKQLNLLFEVFIMIQRLAIIFSKQLWMEEIPHFVKHYTASCSSNVLLYPGSICMKEKGYFFGWHYI